MVGTAWICAEHRLVRLRASSKSDEVAQAQAEGPARRSRRPAVIHRVAGDPGE